MTKRRHLVPIVQIMPMRETDFHFLMLHEDGSLSGGIVDSYHSVRLFPLGILDPKRRDHHPADPL